MDADEGTTRGTMDDLGLSIDMPDADRLRSWANLIDIHGNDISHWGQRQFVIDWLRDFAGRLDTAVREIGQLRAALSPSEADEGTTSQP